MFQTAGLFNGVFTMLDEKTASVWSHIDGLAVSGELAGNQLEILPLVTIRWSDWLAQHPETTVTDINTEYSARYRDVSTLGRDGLRQGFVDTLEEIDGRLPEAELVIGVLAGSAAMAFPVDQAGSSEPMHASVDGVPVVILESASGEATLAYHRALSDGTVLEFERQDDGIFDTTTKSAWNSTGLAVAGPLEGVQLTFVTSFFTEWYGWAAFHPDTSIFGIDG